MKVSHPNDPAEIEADATADRVMRMSVADAKPKFHLSNVTNAIHRKCDTGEDEENEAGGLPIMRKESSSSASPTPLPHAPPSIRNVISSGGQPLDREARNFFEPRFGTDLSHVRIFSDSTAAESAKALDAHAYTLGNNIVFGSEAYKPGSEGGKHLLAHELAHTIQQQSNLGRQIIQRLPTGISSPDTCKAFVPAGEETINNKEEGYEIPYNMDRIPTKKDPTGDPLKVGGKIVKLSHGDNVQAGQVGYEWWRAVCLKVPDRKMPEIFWVRSGFIKKADKPKKEKPKEEVSAPKQPEGVVALEHWASSPTGRPWDQIEYVFPEDMAGILKLVDAVSISTRAHLAKEPDVPSRVSLAIAVVQFTRTDPEVVNSDKYVDEIRNSEKIDRLAIESFIAGAGTATAESLQTATAVDAAAIAANPVGVFQTRLQTKVVAKLNENLALADQLEKKYANTAPDAPEWKHLRNRVAPLIERDRKLLKELNESKDARDTLKHNGTWVSPIEQGETGTGAAGPDDVAATAMKSINRRFLVPEDEIEIEENQGPSSARFQASIAVLDNRIAAMEAAHAGFIAEYPIAAAFERAENVPALESDASNDEIFAALRTEFFAEFRETVKKTIDDVLSGDIDLHELTLFIDETKKELGYDRSPGANAAVDEWLAEEAAAERTREIIFTGIAVVLTVAAFVATGGAALVVGVLGAAAGMVDALYHLEKAADKEQLASAGDLGNEMVEDRDAARFEYWMAILGVALAAVDIAALKNAGKLALGKVKKRPPLSVETEVALAGKTNRARKTLKKFPTDEADEIARLAKEPSNVRPVTDPKRIKEGYVTEIIGTKHEYRLHRNGTWCRFSDEGDCGYSVLADLERQIFSALMKKPNLQEEIFVRSGVRYRVRGTAKDFAAIESYVPTRFQVYEIRDASGKTIYIGITGGKTEAKTAIDRLRGHLYTKEGEFIGDARSIHVRGRDLDERYARALEDDLIDEHSPKWNNRDRDPERYEIKYGQKPTAAEVKEANNTFHVFGIEVE